MNKFKSLSTLIQKTYFSDFQGPFFSFIFPLVILAIAGEIIRSIQTGPANQQLIHWGEQMLITIPGLICLGTVSVCLLSSPIRIIGFKESVIIKRIGITPIKKSDFIITNMGIVVVLSLISALWVFAWAEIFYSGALAAALDHFKNSGLPGQRWYGFFYFFVGVILLQFVCGSIGFLISGLVSTVQSGIGILFLIFFPNMFFSGLIIPVNLINHTSQALLWISYFMPVKYPLQIALEGFFGQNIFHPDLTNPLTHQVYANASSFNKNGVPDWFAFTLSLGLGGTLSTLAVSFWKWET